MARARHEALLALKRNVSPEGSPVRVLQRPVETLSSDDSLNEPVATRSRKRPRIRGSDVCSLLVLHAELMAQLVSKHLVVGRERNVDDREGKWGVALPR